ncbi:hypothetical protein M422DRAFT_265657 [Sphaerobolus stellatus SS14]|uniref:Uncharacterized protein n=1 Tax=Sphaerobolus stellatus (strain SS14) TaxID=990650 RepID=A0A0C9UTD1_SPHS4|nr:hypothetical protein M422DRAFT_265657 [Sphaerobolus stellatus SS14]
MQTTIVILKTSSHWWDYDTAGKQFHLTLAAKLISTGFPFEIRLMDEQVEILKPSWSLLLQALSFIQEHIQQHLGRSHINIFKGKTTMSPSELRSLLSDVLRAISNIVAFIRDISPRNNAEIHRDKAEEVMRSVHRLRSLGRSRLLAMISRQNEL